ncbi:basic proline-rich protein-like [Chionomys nivalis]|uniref:basic proline-rich protein-like n=1 Tax=Chionomys nivalis TaxID=269649 RepID=UPI00259AC6AD|nr:basic proline-rich protein-like [Chionomys nivalis]
MQLAVTGHPGPSGGQEGPRSPPDFRAPRVSRPERGPTGPRRPQARRPSPAGPALRPRLPAASPIFLTRTLSLPRTPTFRTPASGGLAPAGPEAAGPTRRNFPRGPGLARAPSRGGRPRAALPLLRWQVPPSLRERPGELRSQGPGKPRAGPGRAAQGRAGRGGHSPGRWRGACAAPSGESQPRLPRRAALPPRPPQPAPPRPPLSAPGVPGSAPQPRWLRVPAGRRGRRRPRPGRRQPLPGKYRSPRAPECRRRGRAPSGGRCRPLLLDEDFCKSHKMARAPKLRSEERRGPSGGGGSARRARTARPRSRTDTRAHSPRAHSPSHTLPHTHTGPARSPAAAAAPTTQPPSGHVKDKFGARARYECQRRARDSLGGGERREGKGRDGGEAVACRCAGARASERLPPRGRPAPPPRSLPRRLRPGRRARPRREPATSPSRAGPGGREREAARPAPRRVRGREPLARAGPRRSATSSGSGHPRARLGSARLTSGIPAPAAGARPPP